MKDQQKPRLKQTPAQIGRGGVIMDVTTVEQARIAEKAGAVAVMALERVPADIRAAGGIARMADPEMIRRIMEAVSIPVMAKVRIGHFMEAKILEEMSIDFIDESEVLTPADERYHIDKHAFKTPFVCGARDLGEALRRLAEGAAMLRTKGEPGTGNVVEAVRHIRRVVEEMRRVISASDEEISVLAKEMEAAPGLLRQLREEGKLPVLNYAAGGIATPADAAMMMQLGADGIFVGSGIFKAENQQARAEAIVQATAHYDDPAVLLKVSRGLGEAMKGLDIASLSNAERMQERGN